MRTADPKVFAAGDGAFGPSTIVTAMYHGHRAAYYVQDVPRGRSPTRCPTARRSRRGACRSRRTRCGRCSPREHQEFHGLGENPVEFPEIESDYDDETAKREAARCYRCDAETGSSDYNVRTREDIFVMARTTPGRRAASSARSSRSGSRSRPGDHFHPEVAIARRHRVPARPTSRGSSSTRTATPAAWRRQLGDGRSSSRSPFLVGGFDDAPDEVRAARRRTAARERGLAYVGRRPLGGRTCRGSSCSPARTQPDPRRRPPSSRRARTAYPRRGARARPRRPAARARALDRRPAGGDPVRARAGLRPARCSRATAPVARRLARARRRARSLGHARRDPHPARAEPRGGHRRCSTSAASAPAPTRRS